MIAVNLDHRFERRVGDATFVTFYCHQANKEMGRGQVGALRERAFAGLSRDIQVPTVQRFKPLLQMLGQILLSMSHTG